MPGLVPGLSSAQSLGDARGCRRMGGQAEQGHTEWRKKGMLGNDLWTCPEGMMAALGTEPAREDLASERSDSVPLLSQERHLHCTFL